MSFIVVTRIQYSPPVEEEVLALANDSLPIARQQPGLKSVRFHKSHNSDETMMYWEWETKEAHEACMASPEWNELSLRWDKLFNSGNAEFLLDTYELVE